MYLSGKHNWLAVIGGILLFFGLHFTALAQDTTPPPAPLTITPTPLETQFVLPPGDTTILVAGAVLLVLIVLGAVLWTSRRNQ